MMEKFSSTPCHLSADLMVVLLVVLDVSMGHCSECKGLDLTGQYRALDDAARFSVTQNGCQSISVQLPDDFGTLVVPLKSGAAPVHLPPKVLQAIHDRYKEGLRDTDVDDLSISARVSTSAMGSEIIATVTAAGKLREKERERKGSGSFDLIVRRDGEPEQQICGQKPVLGITARLTNPRNLQVDNLSERETAFGFHKLKSVFKFTATLENSGIPTPAEGCEVLRPPFTTEELGRIRRNVAPSE